MSRASLACRVGLRGLRVPGRPAAQFMIWVLGGWRRPRYGVRGAREPSFEHARASRVRQSSFACRVSLRRLWRRPTGWVTAVDQVRPGSRPGHSVRSCKVSVGSYLAHRGELLSSPWGVVTWTWTVSESLSRRAWVQMNNRSVSPTDSRPPGLPRAVRVILSVRLAWSLLFISSSVDSLGSPGLDGRLWAYS